MAEAFLAGLDDRSKEWLLQVNENDMIPGQGIKDLSMMVKTYDRGGAAPLLLGEKKAPSIFMNVTEEGEDYLLGRHIADIPVAVLLKFGNAKDQRFRVAVYDQFVEIITSNWYENDILLFLKIELRPQDSSFKPIVTNICVHRSNVSELKYSSVLQSRKLPAQETGHPVPFQHPPRVQDKFLHRGEQRNRPTMSSSTTWDVFQLVLRSLVPDLLQRQIVIFEHRGAETIPMIATWGNFQVEIDTLCNPGDLDAKKNFLFSRTMANMTVYPPLTTPKSTSSVLQLPWVDGTESICETQSEAVMGPGTLLDLILEDVENVSIAPTKKVKAGKILCDICGSVFERKYDCNRHIRTVHLQEKRFGCPVCAKKFSQSAHLKTHVESVHEQKRDSECLHCGALFSTKYKMQRHVRSVHLKERPHRCSICGLNYFQKTDLLKHLESRHGEVGCFSLESDAPLTISS